jgi:hypothetical protein
MFINVPKLVVSKTPWGEPPSRADRLAKLDPSACSVDKLYGLRAPSIREHAVRRPEGT